MKKLVINGIPNHLASRYTDYEHTLEKDMSKSNTYFKLRDLDFNYCQGCWDCWTKTPGVCCFKDDYEKILSTLPHVDSLEIITPVIAGFEPALVKKFKDRIIPFAHPYIEILEGECHHVRRYPDAGFDISLTVLGDENTDNEALDIIKENYQRVALNFHSELADFCTINPVKESL